MNKHLLRAVLFLAAVCFASMIAWIILMLASPHKNSDLFAPDCSMVSEEVNVKLFLRSCKE